MTVGDVLPAHQVLRIALDVAVGLQQLHARGTVFCGVKPSNTLLDEDGSAFLADLGEAQQLPLGATQLEVQGASGTTYYM